MVSVSTNSVARGLWEVGTQNQTSCQSVGVRSGVQVWDAQSCCTEPGRGYVAGLGQEGSLEKNQVSVILVGLWHGHMKGREDGLSSIKIYVESTQ